RAERRQCRRRHARAEDRRSRPARRRHRHGREASGHVKSWVVRAKDPKTVGEIVVLAKEDVSAIDEGRVFVGKKRARAANELVKPGDEVRIGKPDVTPDVPVLVEKDDLVAVAKPAGIPTVPDHHGSSHSLVAVVARMLKKKP